MIITHIFPYFSGEFHWIIHDYCGFLMKEIWIIADDSGIVMWFGHVFSCGTAASPLAAGRIGGRLQGWALHLANLRSCQRHKNQSDDMIYPSYVLYICPLYVSLSIVPSTLESFRGFLSQTTRFEWFGGALFKRSVDYWLYLASVRMRYFQPIGS